MTRAGDFGVIVVGTVTASLVSIILEPLLTEPISGFITVAPKVLYAVIALLLMQFFVLILIYREFRGLAQPRPRAKRGRVRHRRQS